MNEKMASDLPKQTSEFSCENFETRQMARRSDAAVIVSDKT